MKNTNKLREWATPITIGAFALSAVTGIMLFFKVELGLIKPVHEWLSWLLVIGTILHLIANWKASVHYISKPVGKGILIFFLVLIFSAFIPLGGESKGSPVKKMVGSLIQNPLSEVALIADHNPDEAINILKAKGINVDNKEQTIREIAAKNNKSPIDVLNVIF
ncbi:MAG: DUF4405 domain-containing protein [Deltaproteobacteria bacterium]|jgi:hypothetical protein|nr:DUF4405 domain-containing protein [Deltaproteobacteria bacterium]